MTALPAGCGVVIYYFIRFVHAQSAALSDPAAEITEKLKLISDGLVHNWAMWITVIAFVVVILFVNLLRTRAFYYAWRIAVIARFCDLLNLRNRISINRIRSSINPAVSIPTA